MLTEQTVACPCCGESFVALIDPADGPTRYTQDCEICCRPLRFTLTPDPATGELALAVAREDDA